MIDCAHVGCSERIHFGGGPEPHMVCGDTLTGGHMQDEAHNAMSPVPGLATPWPDPRRFPVTRRLMAYWRWESERGPESEAAHNARRSVENRVAGLGVEVL